MIRAHPGGSTQARLPPGKTSLSLSFSLSQCCQSRRKGRSWNYSSRSSLFSVTEAQGGKRGEVLRIHPSFLLLSSPISDASASLVALPPKQILAPPHLFLSLSTTLLPATLLQWPPTQISAFTLHLMQPILNTTARVSFLNCKSDVICLKPSLRFLTTLIIKFICCHGL